MTANFIQPPANTGLGLKVDVSELVVGANTVERQNICISDPTTAANIATVSAAGALKVDVAGVTTQPVSGSVTVVQGTGTNLHTVLDAGANVIGHVINDASAAVIGHVIADTGSTTAVTGTVTISGAVTEATLDAALIAQEAATTTVKGLTAFGAVTTAAPTYVTAKSDALSLTTAGALRIDGSGATQPISGTVTTTPPSNASTNVAQYGGTTVSAATAGIPDINLKNVGNAAFALGQQVAASALPVVLTAAQITTLTPPAVFGGVVTQATGTNLHVVLDTTSTTAVTQATAANLNATVVGPTLTKGTQGAAGFSIQELKDAGRNQTNYFMAAPIITTVAEVMQSLTGYKGGIAVAATATPAVVTAAKTYRIQRVEVTYWAATVIGGAIIRLRANLSGVGIVTSPLVTTWVVGMPSAFVAGEAATYSFDVPDGMEFAAGTGIAIGVLGAGAVPTTGTITGYVTVAIYGYEY